jgi:hypothetical protein
MSWLDDIQEAPARPVWAAKLPIAIDDLSSQGKALEYLFGDDLNLKQQGQYLVAYTPGPGCSCVKCSTELQRVINTIPGLPFSDRMNGPLNRMILCANCGNKRCPHASDHDRQCTDSNESGQPGSVYQ